MKYWLRLIAIYVLVLTGSPCPASHCAAESEALATGQTHDQHPDSEHLPCTPFCHCTTCAGFTVPQAVAVDCPTELLPTISVAIFFYQPGQRPDVYPAIWQPPKI
jgi:hypothetical protein